MATFQCRYPFLKIVLIPMSTHLSAVGFPEKSQGQHVKFENGFYETKDKNVIAFLRQYNQAIVTEVPDELVAEKKAARPKKKLLTGSRNSTNGAIKDEPQV